MSLGSSHNPPISHPMSTSEVITRLGDHGCENITHRLDMNSCGAYPLSNGGFGDVYRGKLFDGSHVAIKTMRIHMNTHETQKPFKNAARELHTWSKCRHPNVVQLLGLVEFRNQIGMVSLWMENGSLPSYLSKHPETDRYQISTEICEGLAYLHAENIIHGDLKGPNVLISDGGAPMLTDFGNAVLQESTLQFTATTVKTALSPRWAAPELMEGLGKYSFAADVYALGMTILETITGKVPYSDKSDRAVYASLLVTKELPGRPEESIPSNSEGGNQLWSLLTSCWVREPESRPSADHVRDIIKTITQQKLIIDPERFEIAQLARDVFDQLVKHGCTDLSASIDLAGYSASAIAGRSFGDTRQARMMDGTLVAVKSLWLNDMLRDSPKSIKAMIRELYHWSKAQHENILELLGLVMFQDQLGIVSLWMHNGNLQQHIEKNPSIERYPLCVQLAKGVAYLHSIAMIHGDLKANNILVSADGILKISDLDASASLDSAPDFSETPSTRVGTLRWMAPELVLPGEDDNSPPVLRTKQTDIYALGMTMLEIISGKVPYYYHQHDMYIYRALERQQPPIRPQELSGSDDRSAKMWNLLLKCWNHDPSARPGASSLLHSLQSFALDESGDFVLV